MPAQSKKVSAFLPKKRDVTIKEMAAADLKARGDDVTVDSIGKRSKSVRAKIRRYRGEAPGNRYVTLKRAEAAAILDGKERK